ncbi:MAG: ribulokinase [Clostridia bacterium]|nr:ribulokinase [Clostridia bacterium]
MYKEYVIGVDFGTDSVRAVVVDTADGKQISSATSYYKRWKQGLYRHPEKAVFRQHPLDYLESLEECIKNSLADLSDEERGCIKGIGADTTGSTPVPVNKEGTPLALLDEFRENENAMFFLWKDHSAFREAEEINRAFKHGSETDYCKYQGDYCAEWFWAKILHAVRNDESIRENAYTWQEHSDWITAVLCGETRPEKIYHGACAAGHKAYWHSEWGGLPSAELLGSLDPYLVKVRERYGNSPKPSTECVGKLCPEWAEKLGLSENVIISGSSFDAHAGAVGAGIGENTLVSSIGTSAGHMIVEKKGKKPDGNMNCFCGRAEDSILPGYVGVETGQAAFGDIFAWFRNLLMWPLRNIEHALSEEEVTKIEDELLAKLQEQAEKLPPEPFPVSVDWFNGRRYPNTDDSQDGMIDGLTLGMDAPYVFRALVFGAICGMKRIIDGLESQGISIDSVTAVGGISKKSPFVMQMMADVLDKKVAVVDADQTCALGAAIYAAVASGVYGRIEDAGDHMAAKTVREYLPDGEKRDFYRTHYGEYLKLAEFAEGN